jgi:tetratricopeptide (TPR) repeat protein
MTASGPARNTPVGKGGASMAQIRRNLKHLIGLFAVGLSVATPAAAVLSGRVSSDGQANAQQQPKSGAQETAPRPDPRAAYLESMREAVKAKPDSPEAHYQLGLALEMQNQIEEAIASFKHALQLRPDYLEAYNRLYQVCIRAQRYDDAIYAVRQRIALKPDDASLYQQLGQTYFNQHKFEQAIDADKQALEIKPPYNRSYQVYRDMGAALVHLGQFGEALDAFKKSLELKPDDGDTLKFMGWAYENMGRYREAIDAFQKALKSSPNDLYTIVNLAANYVRTGQLADAEKQYREAIRVAPGAPQGYVGLAGILSRQQRLDEAESTLRQGLAITPTSLPVHISLSNVLYQRDKRAEAVAEAREALRLDPKNPTALNNVGYYMVEINENLEEALKFIQRAVDGAPNVPGFRDSLGWAYFKLGRLEEAEQYLAGAAKQTTSPVIHEHLGDVYAKRGKQEMALSEWQKALAELQKTSGQQGDSAQIVRLKSKINGGGDTKTGSNEKSGRT